MSSATMEIYRTESGSVYEVVGSQIRRVSGENGSSVQEWQEYVSINRLPASLFAPGQAGEVLEVLLASGKRIFTSRLVQPFGLGLQ
ncbi:MAG: hypothetical protein ACR2HR_17945 [Euzebya sp.]